MVSVPSTFQGNIHAAQQALLSLTAYNWTVTIAELTWLCYQM